jgi:hypothetical protein
MDDGRWTMAELVEAIVHRPSSIVYLNYTLILRPKQEKRHEKAAQST